MRGQGRRYDFKICVQPKMVANRKEPKQKNLRIDDCCRTKNSWKKNKCALAQKAMFNVATAIAVQRSALAKFGEFIDRLPGADDE